MELRDNATESLQSDDVLAEGTGGISTQRSASVIKSRILSINFWKTDGNLMAKGNSKLKEKYQGYIRIYQDSGRGGEHGTVFSEVLGADLQRSELERFDFFLNLFSRLGIVECSGSSMHCIRSKYPKGKWTRRVKFCEIVGSFIFSGTVLKTDPKPLSRPTRDYPIIPSFEALGSASGFECLYVHSSPSFC